MTNRGNVLETGENISLKCSEDLFFYFDQAINWQKIMSVQPK